MFRGQVCLDCPAIYRDRDETEEMCRLWSELELRKQNSTGLRPADRPFAHVTCEYSDRQGELEGGKNCLCHFSMLRASFLPSLHRLLFLLTEAYMF